MVPQNREREGGAVGEVGEGADKRAPLVGEREKGKGAGWALAQEERKGREVGPSRPKTSGGNRGREVFFSFFFLFQTNFQIPFQIEFFNKFDILFLKQSSP